MHRNSMMSQDMLRVSELKQREEKRVSALFFLVKVVLILPQILSNFHLLMGSYFLSSKRTLQ